MIDARKPVAERINRVEIRIRWNHVVECAPVSVHVGTDPDNISKTQKAGELHGGQLILRDLDPRTRHFFELVPGDGSARRVIAERRIPFDGAHNFRDLGGYETRDGRHVRWGKIFRSDHLAELSEADLAYLGKLGIRLVCDFRAKQEIAEQPNRLPAHNSPLQINPDIIGTALMPGEIQTAIMNGNPDGLDFRRLLIDGNRYMVTQSLDQYRELFRHLESEEFVPLLFHCTAGKDRTGVAAALILLALGVSEKTIMWDYMLTGVYTHDRVETSLIDARMNSNFQFDFDAVRPIMSVRREFLGAAFDAIHQEFATVDDYLEEALLITKPRREALRERLLW